MVKLSVLKWAETCSTVHARFNQCKDQSCVADKQACKLSGVNVTVLFITVYNFASSGNNISVTGNCIIFKQVYFIRYMRITYQSVR